MNVDTLIAIGLTPAQATAYAYAIQFGSVKPTSAAKHLKTTRSNAYKIYDKLVEFGLVNKTEQNNTFIYTPKNPTALTSFTARFRADAVAKENAASRAMNDLLDIYYKNSSTPESSVYSGALKVAEAYRKQISLREDIYFIHTSADIPAMGFDVMDRIRTAPSSYSKQRFGIMEKPSAGVFNQESHKRSNLSVTWRRANTYTAPVEWSVTASSLLVVTYGSEPHAIFIADRLVAAAFLQLWHIVNSVCAKPQI